MKECIICKIKKQISEFYPSGRGYFTSECKECKKSRNAEYDRKNIKKKRKRARDYERRKRAGDYERRKAISNPQEKEKINSKIKV